MVLTDGMCIKSHAKILAATRCSASFLIENIEVFYGLVDILDIISKAVI